MTKEDVINLRYSVKRRNTIILNTIDAEDEGDTINEGHLKAYQWKVRILVLGNLNSRVIQLCRVNVKSHLL